ncbi:hypothetical protein BC938DRAFT_474545 [Jimgerdemannia flammicorona]|nr:hypothetical protein BC938DRAFT_474545 [Jimgerdemannia flammicorona]
MGICISIKAMKEVEDEKIKDEPQSTYDNASTDDDKCTVSTGISIRVDAVVRPADTEDASSRRCGRNWQS